MKTFVLIALSLITINANGQWDRVSFDVNHYKTDTVHCGNELVWIQRYGRDYLRSFAKAQNEVGVEASKLYQLESLLDQINGYVASGQEAYWNIIRAHESLASIKGNYPLVDTMRYSSELRAYQRIDDLRFQTKEARKELLEKIKEAAQQDLDAEKKRIDDSLHEELSREAQHDAAIQAAADEAAHKEFEKACIKKYGARIGKAVANGKILLGMNRKMCIDAWGEPEMTNKSTTKAGVTEKLIYNFKRYIVLKNDKVVTINE